MSESAVLEQSADPATAQDQLQQQPQQGIEPAAVLDPAGTGEAELGD